LIAASGSATPFSESGISISGGTAEVESSDKEIRIRVHGNTGKRIITVPFALGYTGRDKAVLIIPAGGTTQISISYKSSGIDLLPAEQGYIEYIFTRK